MALLGKRLSILAISVLIYFSASSFVLAGEIPTSEQFVNEVSNNVSHEYIVCVAYFSIISEGLRQSGENTTAVAYDKMRDKALQWAVIMAKHGRTDEMANKVTLSRIDLSMKEMTKEIASDMANISILTNHHADRCKEMMEDPDKIMEEWSEKIIKKYSSE